jgi:BlaI family transcriptional regulator, penicillinase repressor
MDTTQIPKPTESELEILQVLWEYKACTVRFVNEQLKQKKETGLTTTLKFMQIMLEKNLITKDENTRPQLYQANVKEADVQKNLLEKFLDATFKGSAMKMVMQTLGNHQTSQDELDEIRKFLDEIENKGGEK